MPQNRLVINFIGSFDRGYVGEVADETHLARELRKLGHLVQECPRDIWKGYCDGENSPDWTDHLPLENADINIICKWHHFNEGRYIDDLRTRTSAPVFYWTWDHMDYNVEGFHYQMSKAADLLLTNDGMERVPSEIKWHYFPFDVADASIPVSFLDKKYDVVFFGSKLGQGDRVEWLTHLNQHYKVKIFSWNHEEWKKLGFDAEPAVYGAEFNKAVSQSRIIVGFNVNDHTWGYWSNRVGKVLLAGGFLLQRYVPGMELFLRNGADYFSSKEEMVNKVRYFLSTAGKNHARVIAQRGYEMANQRFSSAERIKDLNILIERYLEGAFTSQEAIR